MPRRSTGCERCRQRKVRCDEGRPRCQNCSRYGIECPGYRPPAEKDLHFVDQSRQLSRRFGIETNERQQITLTWSKPRKYQWRHKFLDANALGPLDGISKRHIHRAQLLSSFLNLYLPKERDDSVESNFKYLVILPQVDISSQLLQASVETLCLVELGALHQDERCLQEAQESYIKTLHMLTRELSRSRPNQIRNEHILASIVLLALCELFEGIASGNPDRRGWISHMEGAQKYLQYNKEDCLNSQFGQLLFHNVRHSSLGLGYVKREAIIFADPNWLKLTEGLSKSDPFVALYDIASQIPGLLERSDLLLSGPGGVKDQIRLCRRIRELRLQLTGWLLMHHPENGRSPYEIVNVRDMTAFAHLCLDRTFQTVFSFANIQTCNRLQLYWISRLNLDVVLLNISRQSEFNDPCQNARLGQFTDGPSEDLERDVFVTATNYCRSVPYCCEPTTGSVGRQGSFFLQIIESYFEQFGYCNELEWCKSVRRIFNTDAETKNAIHSSQPSAFAAGTAQANVKHRCKSPICNFRVECCAPAPLLMINEYPKDFMPPH